jgi:hypothetical protein
MPNYKSKGNVRNYGISIMALHVIFIFVEIELKNEKNMNEVKRFNI